MFGVRILSVITAYTVILLEVYSGALKGPNWWVYPGALVLSLLFGITVYGLGSEKQATNKPLMASFIEWVLMLAAAFAMAYFANYFGRALLPEIYGGGA